MSLSGLTGYLSETVAFMPAIMVRDMSSSMICYLAIWHEPLTCLCISFYFCVGKLINECPLFTAGAVNLPSIPDKSDDIYK